MTPYVLLLLTLLILWSVSLLIVDAERAHTLVVTESSGNRPAVRSDSRLLCSALAFLMCIMIGWFSGARLYVGTDFINYLRTYDRVEVDYSIEGLTNSRLEPGFLLLNIVTKQFSSSPYAIFASTSLVFATLLFWVAVRLQRNATQLVLLFTLFGFTLASLNVIRQGIAGLLILLAISFLPRSKVLFLILAALASSFHLGALFALVVLLSVYRLRMTPLRTLALCGGAFLVGGLLLTSSAVIQLISYVSPWFASYLVAAEGGGLGIWLVVLFRSCILVLGFIYLSDREESVFPLTALALSLPFSILGTVVIEVARFADYLALYSVVVGCSLLVRRWQSPVWIHSALIGGGIVFYVLFTLNFADLVPYQTH